MTDLPLRTRRFGRWDARVTLGKLGLVVEFYDMEAANIPGGRKVNDYYVKTLLTDEYGPSINRCRALHLYGSSDDMVIEQPQLTEVSDWLWDIVTKTGEM